MAKRAYRRKVAAPLDETVAAVGENSTAVPLPPEHVAKSSIKNIGTTVQYVYGKPLASGESRPVTSGDKENKQGTARIENSIRLGKLERV
jgi:hypothetical protein